MVMCFVFGCGHRSGRDRCHYYRFPVAKRTLWGRLSMRLDRVPHTENDRICSCHFKDGRKDTDPIYFPDIQGKLFDCKDANRKRKLCIQHKPPVAGEEKKAQDSQTGGNTDSVLAKLDGMYVQRCCVPTCKNVNAFLHGRSPPSFHSIPKDPELRKKWLENIRRQEGPSFRVTGATAVCAEHFTANSWRSPRRLSNRAVPTIFSWTEPPNKQSKSSSNDGRVKGEVESQTPAPMSEHDYAQASTNCAKQPEAPKKSTLQVEDQPLAVKTFCIARFSRDPDLVEFYTGFRTYDDFISTFNALKPTAENSTQWNRAQISRSSSVKTPLMMKDIFREDSMPLIDQFFMFLCRVRQDFVEIDLAVRFDISVNSVNHILVTWAKYLYAVLLPIWQHRDTINEVMPECFKKTYPNTRVLLDCTEIKVQSSSSKSKDSESYSDYRYAPHSTMKGLVGISPEGMINFVSALYPGSISDTDITKQCGIVDLFDEGDDVMADDGFAIQNLLSPKGANLICPRFLRKKGQSSPKKKLKESEENARLRVHIEDAIQKLKAYRIFDSVVPATLADFANHIWTVCCLLRNFHGKTKSLSLVRELKLKRI